MSTMESLFAETTSMLQNVQLGLGELERSSTQQDAESTHDRLKQNLDKICSNCDELEVQAGRIPASKRMNTKYRIDQLKYDHVHLVAALAALRNKVLQRFSRASERDELLQRKFTANDGADSTTLQMGADDADHNTRLHGASRDLDDLIAHGQSVLSSIRDQGFNLKSVRKKILDVGNQLGLSNTVMRMIERRTEEDKYVLFIGMAVTTLIMFGIYYWLTWWSYRWNGVKYRLSYLVVILIQVLCI